MKFDRSGAREKKQRTEGFWAALAIGAIGGCLILVAFAHQASLRDWSLRTPAIPESASDEFVRAGSILFVPLRGDDCQHSVFDNLTGQIWPAGIIGCDIALARNYSEKPKSWSAARVEAIRSGFRWK